MVNGLYLYIAFLTIVVLQSALHCFTFTHTHCGTSLPLGETVLSWFSALPKNTSTYGEARSQTTNPVISGQPSLPHET